MSLAPALLGGVQTGDSELFSLCFCDQNVGCAYLCFAFLAIVHEFSISTLKSKLFLVIKLNVKGMFSALVENPEYSATEEFMPHKLSL